MKISEKFEKELQAIELSIMKVYRDNSGLLDTQVERAIETAIKIQNSILKGRETPHYNLSSLDFIVFESIQRVNQNLIEQDVEFSHLDLLECLKLIRKSVQRWNKKCGRQGYLNFVNQYV